MAHDHLKSSIEAQTGKASVLLIATFMGGILVMGSFLAEYLFQDQAILDEAGNPQNPHADILALLGAILLGIPMIWHALKHLYLGHMHMDELVAMAIVAAIALGKYQEAGIIAFFMIMSNLIETRTALGARATIESLLRITPDTANLLNADGSETEVVAKDLKTGQIVLVRPGDNIPADGVVATGESTINQATITGESMPVDKKAGDEVFSGTINLTGALQIKVTKAGQDTTLGRVQSLILEAERTRIPLMRIIDQYAGWYTPTILMLAGVVMFFTEVNRVDRAIAMLVVACPCALVLATPTAMVAALSAAARMGVLIKNVIHLEHARSLTAIVIDKTGTLTTGELSVTQMKPAPGVEGADLLQTAASVGQLSKHPTAQAVAAVAKRAKLTLDNVDGFEEVSGRGVQANRNGSKIMVGRSTWLAESGVDMSITKDPEFQEIEGLSMLYVARDQKCLGWIALEDRTRPEAREAIDALRELGVLNLTMVTGDKWSVANRVAAEMGCTQVQAEVLPAEKLDLVSDLKERGYKVAVVGDGVNDAPALAAGDLGIAMGAAGSDVAINSASIALMNNDLSRLPFLIRLSRAATKVVWQNLFLGVLFIIVFEILAAFGVITAVLAAVLHTIASGVVIFNSARLVRFGEEQQLQESPPATTPAAAAPAPVPAPA